MHKIVIKYNDSDSIVKSYNEKVNVLFINEIIIFLESPTMNVMHEEYHMNNCQRLIT